MPLSAPRSTSRSAAPAGDSAYRVMVVDDSAVIRGLISRALESDPMVSVIASVGDGQMALNAMKRHTVDVIVLDIEMPVMDGLTALPKLLQMDRAVKVVMASTLTKKNADISIRALQAGAADYLAKPTSTRELSGADDFNRTLREKVRELAALARRQRGEAQPIPDRASKRASISHSLAAAKTAAPIRTRPMPTAVFAPKVIAIGSSTGGPQALFKVIGQLSDLKLPIIVTQHMPATFTTILAEHIGRQCNIPSVEASDGMPLEAGRVHVAPGDFHMLVESRGDRHVLSVRKDPPENFCRPAVDPMLRSVVKTFGSRALTVILTGMGHDGLKGSREIVAAGGVVLAQDEASSVVWGMPGAVTNAGLCSAVLPIDDIGGAIRRIVTRTAA